MVDKMARSEEILVEKDGPQAGSESGYQSNTICVVRGVFQKLEIVASFDFESSEQAKHLALTSNLKRYSADLPLFNTTLNHAIF